MDMLFEIGVIIFLTFIPTLELRASIPYGIFSSSMHWSLVFIVAVVANIVLAPIVYVFLNKFVHMFFRFSKFHRFYHKNVELVQNKIHKNVEKYGEYGLALFIGVPLPGSGVYTGVLAGYCVGLDYKRTMIASVFGVLIAGILVTVISLSGNSIFNIFLKGV